MFSTLTDAQRTSNAITLSECVAVMAACLQPKQVIMNLGTNDVANGKRLDQINIT